MIEHVAQPKRQSSGCVVMGFPSYVGGNVNMNVHRPLKDHRVMFQVSQLLVVHAIFRNIDMTISLEDILRPSRCKCSWYVKPVT